MNKELTDCKIYKLILFVNAHIKTRGVIYSIVNPGIIKCFLQVYLCFTCIPELE